MSGFAFVGLAAAADTDAVAPDGVSSKTVATLSGDPANAARIKGGTYSPDHRRILFQMAAPAADDVADTRSAEDWVDYDFYVMRADGSQLTRLTTITATINGYHLRVSDPRWWPGGQTISWNYTELTRHDTGRIQTATVATDGPIDTWDRASLGWAVTKSQYTPDGRFLAWSQETWSFPFSTDFVVDLATGDQYRVRSSQPSSNGGDATWTWAEQCDRAALPAKGAGNGGFDETLAAISGPSPACRFGAQPHFANGPAASFITPAEPAAEPAPTANAATPAALVPTSERLPTPVRPTITVRATSSRLSLARKRGFNVKYDVAGTTSVKTWVVLSSALSEYELDVQAKAGDTVTLARASQKITSDGRVSQRLAFDAKAQAALLKFYRVTVTLRMTATDTAGRRTTVEQPVTLSR
jgi:hypothetical protein